MSVGGGRADGRRRLCCGRHALCFNLPHCKYQMYEKSCFTVPPPHLIQKYRVPSVSLLFQRPLRLNAFPDSLCLIVTSARFVSTKIKRAQATMSKDRHQNSYKQAITMFYKCCILHALPLWKLARAQIRRDIRPPSQPSIHSIIHP